MRVRFWGVRGSLPAPGPATIRYGGNTICVELRCGPHLVILDAGTGLRDLGVALAAKDAPVDADLLLSHTHLDHICGLPFFKPMYDPTASLRFWAGHLSPPASIAEALRLSWSAPLMPDMEAGFRACRTFHDFTPGDVLSLRPGLRVTTVRLRHPGDAVGYRVEWAGASLCYITDTEHPPAGPDEALLRFVAGAGVMIYDATYTEAEYKSRVGWGHSTWEAAVALADAAAVGRLVLFHHDPLRDDAALKAIARSAAGRRRGTLVAREGMNIDVGSGAMLRAARSPRLRAAG
jgi:phosphoribosyl 1,2-cyclic phosphodiesterase